MRLVQRAPCQTLPLRRSHLHLCSPTDLLRVAPPTCVQLRLSASAVDTFCEHLEALDILPYMKELLEQLMAVLQGAKPDVQEMALSAVSSIAAAAQGAFQPYTGGCGAHRHPGVTRHRRAGGCS